MQLQRLARASLLLLLLVGCCCCTTHVVAAEAVATSGPPRAHVSSVNDASHGANASTAAAFDAPQHQALWLDRHNWLRSDGLVWPAADMMALEWDFTLAAEAQSAIASCAQQPQDARGLLVFVDSTPGRALDASLIDEAIGTWGLHDLFAAIPTLAPPLEPGDAVGLSTATSTSRYGQLVWATTTRVGCAYTVCAQGRLAACKYSPAADPEAPNGWYTFGPACSRCASARCIAGLCVDSMDVSSTLRTITLPVEEQAAALFLPHKVRSLQLALNAMIATQRSSRRTTDSVTTVAALSTNASATIGTLCNGTVSAPITQEQLSMLTLDGGLSPLAVVFGLFLGVSVILVMIVCIMHATKPKRRRDAHGNELTPQQQASGNAGSLGVPSPSPDKELDDERVQVV